MGTKNLKSFIKKNKLILETFSWRGPGMNIISARVIGDIAFPLATHFPFGFDMVAVFLWCGSEDLETLIAITAKVSIPPKLSPLSTHRIQESIRCDLKYVALLRVERT
jgi:hypothetical protein